MVKKRENSRWISERRDPEGRLLCLVPPCEDLRQPYKTSDRTRNYCKNHSGSDMSPFTSWVGLRSKILKRDNYCCVKCKNKESYEHPLIADHIIAIALGGDEWDMDNIQTLCSKCNKIKTANDAKEIAKLRHSEKLIDSGQKQLVEVVI